MVAQTILCYVNGHFNLEGEGGGVGGGVVKALIALPFNGFFFGFPTNWTKSNEFL